MNRLLIKENYTSVNLWEKVNLLTKPQIETLLKGLEWTFNNIPDAVLIGGTATVHYISGKRELTPDLDFLISDTELVRVKLAQENIVFHDLLGSNGSIIGFTAPELNVDFLESMIGNKNLNRLILETANITIIGGFEVKVICPELLAIMKLELCRERDLNDAFAILASGECDADKYKTYLMQLKTNLQDFDSIWSYNELIK